MNKGTYSAPNQVALKERGIDKLVDEARQDQKENDAIQMGRRCKSGLSMLQTGMHIDHVLQDTRLNALMAMEHLALGGLTI